MPPFFDQVEGFENVSPALQWAIFVVAALIVIVAICSVAVSIYLSIRYFVYNRKQNSAGLTGAEVARRILDQNGLEKIKVSTWGSMIFGNSYSHYFHKVRIRRLTQKKTSITSMAIGAQKSALAILDKEDDPDMKRRIVLTPLIYLGPLALIPIALIGIVVDILFFNFTGVVSFISVSVGLLLYVVSFILSIMVLKTEIKAQARCLEILKAQDMANDEEIEMMKKLFKLYNIQYVNDIIMQVLEMIMRILQLMANSQRGTSTND